MTAANASLPPQAVLSQMINAYWQTGALCAAARLGIADAVTDSARPVAELAASLDVHEESLFRLMRALSSLGVFAEGPPRCFAHTPLSNALRTGVPGSMHGLALMTGMLHTRAWPELAHGVKTGGSAFAKVFGESLFTHVTKDVEAGAAFDDAMTGYTAASANALVAAYDFARFKTVVDVGGGSGALLSAILRRAPDTAGVNFDLPKAAERAKAYLSAQGQAGRCEVIGGDFFETVPAGGDAYLLKAIVHDWDDESCIKILKNVRKAMGARGTLLVMDAVLEPETSAGAAAKLFDINMMVMTSGRERTAEQFGALLQASSFHVVRIVTVNPTLSVIEAAPV